MESEQYDVSEKLKRLFIEKQKQRAAAKEYYMKLVYNPHRPVCEGATYDPAIQRFSAMSSYHCDYFKPQPKTYLKFAAFLSPIAIAYFHLRYLRDKQEETLRSGLVRYEDRTFKYAF